MEQLRTPHTSGTPHAEEMGRVGHLGEGYIFCVWSVSLQVTLFLVKALFVLIGGLVMFSGLFMIKCV